MVDAPVRRGYRSPARDAARDATRAAIVAAAQSAFAAHGWAGTTVAGVAAAAGVSAQTVYDGFGTKAALLGTATREAAAGGADRQVIDEAWVAELQRARGVRARWELLRAGTAEVLERTLPLQAVVRDAIGADEAVAALWQELEAERRRDVEAVIGLLADAGPLRMRAAEAVELVLALTRATDLYGSLRAAGWSAERASSAVSDVIARAILPS